MPLVWVAWAAVWAQVPLPMRLGIFMARYLAHVLGAVVAVRMYGVVLIYAIPWTLASKRPPAVLILKFASPTGTSAIPAMAQVLNLGPHQTHVAPVVARGLCVCSRAFSACSKHVRPVTVPVRKSKTLAPNVMGPDGCVLTRLSR